MEHDVADFYYLILILLIVAVYAYFFYEAYVAYKLKLKILKKDTDKMRAEFDKLEEEVLKDLKK